LQEFNFCDSLKQSIKLSFCGTSWDVILFPWFPIDPRITKEIAGQICFSCFFLGRKITVREGEQFWVSCSFKHWWVYSLALLPQSFGISSSFEVVDYSSSQHLVSSSWIWNALGKNWYGIWNIWSCPGSELHQTSNELAVPFSSSYSWNFLGVGWGSIRV